MFDPNQLLDMQTNEANESVYTPCPVGEYPAVIDDIQVKSGTIGKGDRMGEPWTSLNVKWVIENTAANQAIEQAKIVVFQSIMLDLTAQGGLEGGRNKNVRLGALREAINLNTSGQPFSFRMMLGRQAKIAVAHEIYQGAVQAKVSGVVKL